MNFSMQNKTDDGGNSDSDYQNQIVTTAHPVEASFLNIMQKYSIPAKARPDLMR